MIRDYRRALSGLLAAVMVMSQSAGVLAAESSNFAAAADGNGNYEVSGSPEAYGFPGGYGLDQEDLELKEEMAANGMAQSLEEKEDGKDYISGRIWFPAESREEADAIAAAYNAEVVKYSYGVADAELKGDNTVLDAVRAAADPGSGLPPVEPQYLCQLEPEVSEELLDSEDEGLDAAGITVDEPLKWKDYLFGNNSKEDDPEMQEPILDNPDPLLTDPSNLYDSDTEYQYQHDQVNTWEAWGSSIGSSGVKVAVIDSGVFAEHEDFIDPVSGRSIVESCVDVTRSTDGKEIEPELYVTNFHGTHVAGIIAAQLNNGKGGAGIAPGVTIKPYNIIFCSEGVYEQSDAVRAINAAVADGVDIINMSIGSKYYSVFERQAVTKAYEAGICVFASAGNSGSNDKNYPAAYASIKNTGIIAVGATNHDGKKAPYSTKGNWVTVCAPGTKIRSTSASFIKPENDKDAEISTSELKARLGSEYEPSTEGTYHRYELDTLSSNCYCEASGTSMACPVAAGVAALYLSAYGPTLNGSKVLVGKDLPKKMKSILTTYGTAVSGVGKRVNVGAMFGGESKSPAIIALDDEYNEVPRFKPKKNIYKEVSYVVLNSKATLSWNRINTESKRYNTWDKEKIYYTVDGGEPKVDPKTLTLMSGTLYKASNPLVIKNFKPGSKHTIRALAVTSSKKITPVASVTVYAPEADKTTMMNPTVKKVELKAKSTADEKKEANRGKKSIVYFSDNWYTVDDGETGSSASAKALNPSSTDVPYGLGFDEIVPTLRFTSGSSATVGDFTDNQLECIKWGSSDGNVLSVQPKEDGTCRIIPLKKGNCKVNIWVYSNGKVQKSQTISVSAKRAVDEINITGLDSIDPGKGNKAVTTTYKAECLPKEANEKKVSWYLRGGNMESSGTSAVDATGISYSDRIEIGGGTVEINTKSGKLKMTGVTADPSDPDTFLVAAISNDTGLVIETKEVTIGSKSTEGLKIAVNEDELTHFQKYREKDKDRVVYNDNGTCLKSFVVASVDIPEKFDGNDNVVRLYSKGNVPVQWTVSDKNIAKVVPGPDQKYADVYGLKGGSATINCKASDGSGKSAKITVYVKNPVASVGLGVNKDGDYGTIAVGKTLTPSASIGKTFGNPSNSTLEWELQAGYVTYDEEKDRFSLGEIDKKLTASILDSDAVTFDDKNGKTTISKTKWSRGWNDKVFIRLIAKTTDGSENSDFCEYVVTTPATGVLLFDSDFKPLEKNAMYEFKGSGGSNTIYAYVDSQGKNFNGMQVGDITVSSSKPECGAGFVDGSPKYYEKLECYAVEITLVPGDKKGTASVTVKANDGTGKSASVKVKTLASAE